MIVMSLAHRSTRIRVSVVRHLNPSPWPSAQKKESIAQARFAESLRNFLSSGVHPEGTASPSPDRQGKPSCFVGKSTFFRWMTNGEEASSGSRSDHVKVDASVTANVDEQLLDKRGRLVTGVDGNEQTAKAGVDPPPVAATDGEPVAADGTAAVESPVE
jgi:hypothetical protein